MSELKDIPEDAPIRLIGILAQPHGLWRYDGVSNGRHIFRRSDISTSWSVNDPLEVRRDPHAPSTWEVKPAGFDHPQWPAE